MLVVVLLLLLLFVLVVVLFDKSSKQKVITVRAMYLGQSAEVKHKAYGRRD